MDRENIGKLRGAIEDIKATLAAAVPFLYTLLAKARIVATRRNIIAAVDRSHTVYINPEKFLKYDFVDRTAIIMHEVLHLAFSHPNRRGRRKANAWNVACDATINNILFQYIRYHNLSPVTLSTIQSMTGKYISDMERMSAEEIYELIKDLPEMESETDLFDDLSSDDDEVIQDGGKDIYEGDEAERVEKWSQELYKAYSIQKSAGKIPEGLKRIVDELFAPKIPWQTMLRNVLREAVGRTVVSTWKRLSRKHPELPGQKRFTIPTTWVLIDTSGSISDSELKEFLGEVYAIASMTEVKVICWDADAYDIVAARSRNDVVKKVIESMKGGGGTKIRKALEKTLKNMKSGDIVIVMTDGDIYDINTGIVRDMAKRVSYAASRAIIVSNSERVELPGWATIMMG